MLLDNVLEMSYVNGLPKNSRAAECFGVPFLSINENTREFREWKIEFPPQIVVVEMSRVFCSLNFINWIP